MRSVARSCLALILGTSAVAPVACSTTDTGGAAGGGAGGAGAAGASAGGGATTGVGSSAGGSAPGNLKLESATLVSGTDVLLVFSEAVAPTIGVSPEDFRLSGVIETDIYNIFVCSNLAYCDTPKLHDCYSTGLSSPGPSMPSEYRCPPSYQGKTFYYGVGSFEALAPGAMPNQLVARLALGITSDACDGLDLHYAPRGSPVKSVSGDELAPFGNAAWVAHPTRRFENAVGALPNKPRDVNTKALDLLCKQNKGCQDGLWDGSEGDVDCGQDCPMKCQTGQHCNRPSDCATMICTNQVCAAQ